MKRIRRLLTGVVASLLSLPALAATDALIVTGLGGEPRYADAFAAQSTAIATALGTLPGDVRVTALDGETADAGTIAAWFAERRAPDTLLVFLVGHGSFDDIEYRFNIPGPDITAADLAGWLDDAGNATQLVVLTGSASGAAADVLASERRIVITATRSGVERHATRFGEFFVAALSDPGADLDKNERVSAREAFDFASRAVADAFSTAQQLATEHARLEGARADRLTLSRLAALPSSTPGTSIDPELARLMEVRERIQAEIETLRLTRDDTPPALYRAELTRLIVALAEAEEAIEAYEAASDVR